MTWAPWAAGAAASAACSRSTSRRACSPWSRLPGVTRPLASSTAPSRRSSAAPPSVDSISSSANVPTTVRPTSTSTSSSDSWAAPSSATDVADAAPLADGEQGPQARRRHAARRPAPAPGSTASHPGPGGRSRAPPARCAGDGSASAACGSAHRPPPAASDLTVSVTLLPLPPQPGAEAVAPEGPSGGVEVAVLHQARSWRRPGPRPAAPSVHGPSRNAWSAAMSVTRYFSSTSWRHAVVGACRVRASGRGLRQRVPVRSTRELHERLERVDARRARRSGSRPAATRPRGRAARRAGRRASITSRMLRRRSWSAGSSTGTSASTRRSRLRSIMSAEPMRNRSRSPWPKHRIRECSR